MGKSFKKNNFSENSNRNQQNNFKRRRNQIKEEHSRDEWSDYKIHGVRKEKNSN
jgi:hypothetical protein